MTIKRKYLSALVLLILALPSNAMANNSWSCLLEFSIAENHDISGFTDCSGIMNTVFDSCDNEHSLKELNGYIFFDDEEPIKIISKNSRGFWGRKRAGLRTKLYRFEKDTGVLLETTRVEPEPDLIQYMHAQVETGSYKCVAIR